MFERYTEKARRAVFFGRYEASQFRSPYIETEHLLLGILREDAELVRSVLPVSFQSVRREIEARVKPGSKKVSTNIDLPLTEDVKRTLKYALEEADRLNHRHIGTAHLLLGLASDKTFASAEVLAHFGVELEQLRKKVEALGDPAPGLEGTPRRIADYIAAHRRQLAPSTIEIHGVKRNIEHIHILVSRCREQGWHWEQKQWKPHDVVIKKDGKGLSLDLTLAERAPHEFTLVPGGWKKDYCAICHWEMFESDDAAHGTGFTNGKDWVCTECHQRFIAGNFFASPYTDLT